MIHLTSLKLKGNVNRNEYPYNLPIFKDFKGIHFITPITYFIGENGTGKSTVLEAIAAGANSITIGSESIERDKTMEQARKLANSLQFSWTIKTHKGFYIRSEDVFGFTKWLHSTKEELDEIVSYIDKTSSGYGRQLARGSVLGQRRAFEGRYGENLDANSHGETFLKVFQARFQPGGLYLLDEPETPLSFKRQLSLMFMLKQMVKQDSQFIIVTHSPILTALPDATIFSFDSGSIKQIKYEDIEQFSLMKEFLKNPESFLRHLDEQ